MKAGRFAIRGPEIQQVQAEYGERDVRRPRGDPGGNVIAFTKREKKMGKQVAVKKNQHNGYRDAPEHATPGIADAQRPSHENYDQTRPRQRQPILQMGAKRGEQRRRKIAVEMQVFAQLG